MHQYELIERIVEALELYDGMETINHTPLKGNLLVKYEYRLPSNGQFSYSSVMGMLLYLVGHTHTNIYHTIK